MEFMRLGAVGSEVPVLRCEGGSFDLRPLTDDLTPEFIARGGLTAAREALRSGRLAPLPDAETLRVGSPIARPHAVMCIGLNYAAHAAESNAPAPSSPILFFKHPNTLAGPDDAVPLPAGAERVDWEVELAIVIGSRASYTASSAAAAKHIAGFCLADDLSEREFQLNRSAGQWSKGQVVPWFPAPRTDAGTGRCPRPDRARDQFLGQRRAAAAFQHDRHDLLAGRDRPRPVAISRAGRRRHHPDRHAGRRRALRPIPVPSRRRRRGGRDRRAWTPAPRNGRPNCLSRNRRASGWRTFSPRSEPLLGVDTS